MLFLSAQADCIQAGSSLTAFYAEYVSGMRLCHKRLRFCAGSVMFYFPLSHRRALD